MQCPNCQASVKPGARFCGSCGHTLEPPSCSQCHAPISTSHRFCAKCGNDLQTEKLAPPVPIPAEDSTRIAPAPVESEKTDKKSRKSLWLALATVLVIVLVGALLYWIWPLGGSNGTLTPAATAEGTRTPTLTLTTTVEVADEIWEQAQEAADNGDIPGAVALLRQLRSDYPNYEPEQIVSKQEALCTSWYSDSADLIEPDLLDAFDCLAEIGVDPPDGPEVKAWWEDYFEVSEELGKGQSEEAIAVLALLVKTAPADFADGRHISLLYEAYLQQGDALCAQAAEEAEFDVARSWYQQARMLDPSRTEAVSRLTSCQTPTLTPTITPTATSTPTPLPPGAMKATFDQDGGFNVRSGPGYNYPIIATVEAGAVFTVTARTEDAQWLEAVQTDGTDVWVWGDLLEINYPAKAAPIAEKTPVPPTDYVIADSVADFGFPQGTNRWWYLASTSPGSLVFVQIPRDGGWYRRGGTDDLMRLSREGSYPRSDSDAMRMWVNFYEGMLRIEGRARKERGAGYGGNGVELSVMHRRPGTDQSPGFETELWKENLGSYDTQGFDIRIGPFAVEQWDEIYFVTSAKDDDDDDNTIFTARIILMNEGGVKATPIPAFTPTPTKPPPQPLCFEPRLRQHEQSRGGIGEAAGIVYNSSEGAFTRASIWIEGPPGADQWAHEFPVGGDGGYEVTALSVHPPPFAYTMKLVGRRIRNNSTFSLTYPDGEARRAIVDWYLVTCK